MNKIITSVVLISLCGNAVAAMNRHKPRQDLTTTAGDFLQIAIPLSAAIYSAFISDWNGELQLAGSWGATLATTYTMKYTIREERPYQPEGTKGVTFPSGHTSSAFAGAAYWQMRYGWWVGMPMYATASFVAYSRVHSHMHNWLDVATGAAIGIGFNLLFTSRYNKDDNTQLSLMPMPGGAYLNFGFKF